MSPSKEIKNNSSPPKGEWEKGLSQSPRNAYIYILRCSDNTYYTGVTYDLTRRLMDHNEWKKWAKYTRGRRPLELVYQESLESYGSALSREYEIKKLPRAS